MQGIFASRTGGKVVTVLREGKGREMPKQKVFDGGHDEGGGGTLHGGLKTRKLRRREGLFTS